MSRTPVVRSALVRRITVAIGIGALAAATGCFRISPRVWQNGQAMTSSWQYQDVLSGNANPATLRGMYFSSNARVLGQRSIPYPAFGHW